MTRMSKQGERRAISYKRPKPPSTSKTGPKKDKLIYGFRPHENCAMLPARFIPKIA